MRLLINRITTQLVVIFILFIIALCVDVFVLVIAKILGLSISAYLSSLIFPIVSIIVSLASLKSLHTLSIKPRILMDRGEYAKSLALYKKNLKKNLLLKIDRESRDATLCNIANVYHRMGLFEDSIEWLNKLNPNRMGKNLKGAYYWLYAANLLFLEREMGLVEEYLRLAMSLINLPGINLYFSYYYLLNQEIELASEAIESYINSLNRKKKIHFGFIVLYSEPKFVETQEGYLMGYYYQAKNEMAKAKELFVQASACPYEIFYKRKAVEMLEKLA